MLQRKCYAIRNAKGDLANEDESMPHKWVWEAKDLEGFPKQTADTIKKYRKLRKLVWYLELGSRKLTLV